jgi:DNA repair protein RadA/Sms
MLLAVLEARCGLNFSSAEVYLNVAGGYRLADPAADLAVAAALVSALAERPLPAESIWFGEVSLAGEVRPVAHPGLRLKEAAKLGFMRAYGPEVAAGDRPAQLRHDGLRLLPNLVDRVMASP